MEFPELIDFIDNRMKMSHIYHSCCESWWKLPDPFKLAFMGPLCLAPGVFRQEIPVIHRRNPKTGKKVKIKSKQLPFFKPGKELKERVDG